MNLGTDVLWNYLLLLFLNSNLTKFELLGHMFSENIADICPLVEHVNMKKSELSKPGLSFLSLM